jgi:hypothetical protein
MGPKRYAPSADGRRVVTASDDETARVWDAATGKAIGEPLKHAKAVTSAQFSPDGQRVVTASDWVKNRIQEGTRDDSQVAMLVDPANAHLPHILVWRSPILLSQKKQIQTMPDERGQKLIFKRDAP